jgi:hypothetical protein
MRGGPEQGVTLRLQPAFDVEQRQVSFIGFGSWRTAMPSSSLAASASFIGTY